MSDANDGSRVKRQKGPQGESRFVSTAAEADDDLAGLLDEAGLDEYEDEGLAPEGHLGPVDRDRPEDEELPEHEDLDEDLALIHENREAKTLRKMRTNDDDGVDDDLDELDDLELGDDADHDNFVEDDTGGFYTSSVSMEGGSSDSVVAARKMFGDGLLDFLRGRPRPHAAADAQQDMMELFSELFGAIAFDTVEEEAEERRESAADARARHLKRRQQLAREVPARLRGRLRDDEFAKPSVGLVAGHIDADVEELLNVSDAHDWQDRLDMLNHEVSWIMSVSPRFRSIDEAERKAVLRVLILMRVYHLEVAYIDLYRSDYLCDLSAYDRDAGDMHNLDGVGLEGVTDASPAPQRLLSRSDLDLIDELDSLYAHLCRRRSALQETVRVASVKIPSDLMSFRAMRQALDLADTEEQLDDIQDVLSRLPTTAMLKDMVHDDIRRHCERNHLLLPAGAMDTLARALLGATSQGDLTAVFLENLRQESLVKVPAETEEVILQPLILGQGEVSLSAVLNAVMTRCDQHLQQHFKGDTQRVRQALQKALARRLSLEPFLREFVRDFVASRGIVDTSPTPTGLTELDDFTGDFALVKRLEKKPVHEMLKACEPSSVVEDLTGDFTSRQDKSLVFGDTAAFDKPPAAAMQQSFETSLPTDRDSSYWREPVMVRGCQGVLLQQAEKRGLIRVSLTLSEQDKGVLLQRLTSFLVDASSSKSEFDDLRRSLIQETLETHLLPLAYRRLKEQIRRRSERLVARLAVHRLRRHTRVQPYVFSEAYVRSLRLDEDVEDVLDDEGHEARVPCVVAVSVGAHTEPSVVVAVDQHGHLLDVQALHHFKGRARSGADEDSRDTQFQNSERDRLRKRSEDVQRLAKFLRKHMPSLVAVDASSHSSMRVLNAIYGEVIPEVPTAVPIQVMLVEATVSSALSKQRFLAQQLHERTSANARLALSLARHCLNPVAELCQLAISRTFDGAKMAPLTEARDRELPPTDGLYSLHLHPLLECIPKRIALQALERELVRVVCLHGVDVNRMRRHPHLAAMLPFVCGLGPLEAERVFRFLKDREYVVSRAELRDAGLSESLFENCAGFLRVETTQQMQREQREQSESKKAKKHENRARANDRVYAKCMVSPLECTRIAPTQRLYHLARQVLLCARQSFLVTEKRRVLDLIANDSLAPNGEDPQHLLKRIDEDLEEVRRVDDLYERVCNLPAFVNDGRSAVDDAAARRTHADVFELIDGTMQLFARSHKEKVRHALNSVGMDNFVFQCAKAENDVFENAKEQASQMASLLRDRTQISASSLLGLPRSVCRHRLLRLVKRELLSAFDVWPLLSDSQFGVNEEHFEAGDALSVVQRGELQRNWRLQRLLRVRTLDEIDAHELRPLRAPTAAALFYLLSGESPATLKYGVKVFMRPTHVRHYGVQGYLDSGVRTLLRLDQVPPDSRGMQRSEDSIKKDLLIDTGGQKLLQVRVLAVDFVSRRLIVSALDDLLRGPRAQECERLLVEDPYLKLHHPDDDPVKRRQQRRLEQLRKQPFVRRQIEHPQFHNISAKDAVEKLRKHATEESYTLDEDTHGQDASEALIFRPCRSRDELRLSWRVSTEPFLVAHFRVKEPDRRQAQVERERRNFAEAQRLEKYIVETGRPSHEVSESVPLKVAQRLIAKSAYEDLDDIAGTFVHKMRTRVQEVMKHKNFRYGSEKEVRDMLDHMKENNPLTVPYALCFMEPPASTDDSEAVGDGRFRLFWLPGKPGTPPGASTVAAAPGGFHFRGCLFSSLRRLLNWFKLNPNKDPRRRFSQPPPSQFAMPPSSSMMPPPMMPPMMPPVVPPGPPGAAMMPPPGGADFRPLPPGPAGPGHRPPPMQRPPPSALMRPMDDDYEPGY